MSNPNLHKCELCGRLFAMEYWLELHGEKHRREEYHRRKAVQAKLDAQWHADHPGPLMKAWNRILDILMNRV